MSVAKSTYVPEKRDLTALERLTLRVVELEAERTQHAAEMKAVKDELVFTKADLTATMNTVMDLTSKQEALYEMVLQLTTKLNEALPSSLSVSALNEQDTVDAVEGMYMRMMITMCIVK